MTERLIVASGSIVAVTFCIANPRSGYLLCEMVGCLSQEDCRFRAFTPFCNGVFYLWCRSRSANTSATAKIRIQTQIAMGFALWAASLSCPLTARIHRNNAATSSASNPGKNLCIG